MPTNPFESIGMVAGLKGRKTARRLAVSSQGQTSTGKSGFVFRTAPGPIACISTDPNTLDSLEASINDTGRDDIFIKHWELPQSDEIDKVYPHAAEAWNDIHNTLHHVVDNRLARTVMYDTEDKIWEILRLAKFGKLKGVPQLDYKEVNPLMESLLRYPANAGIHLVSTHRVSMEYETVTKTSKAGKTYDVSEATGRYRRDGFKHTQFIFQVEVEHLSRPILDKNKKVVAGLEFGLRILKCTANASITNQELWGPDECTFQVLGQLVYPTSNESDWS